MPETPTFTPVELKTETLSFAESPTPETADELENRLSNAFSLGSLVDAHRHLKKIIVTSSLPQEVVIMRMLRAGQRTFNIWPGRGLYGGKRKIDAVLARAEYEGKLDHSLAVKFNYATARLPVDSTVSPIEIEISPDNELIERKLNEARESQTWGKILEPFRSTGITRASATEMYRQFPKKQIRYTTEFEEKTKVVKSEIRTKIKEMKSPFHLITGKGKKLVGFNVDAGLRQLVHEGKASLFGAKDENGVRIIQQISGNRVTETVVLSKEILKSSLLEELGDMSSRCSKMVFDEIVSVIRSRKLHKGYREAGLVLQCVYKGLGFTPKQTNELVSKTSGRFTDYIASVMVD